MEIKRSGSMLFSGTTNDLGFMMDRFIRFASSAVLLTAFFSGGPLLAQKQYGPGVSDDEIKIGNTAPYSGPASAYSSFGKTFAAFFKMINDEGGVHGRRINFISYDDAYSPPKTVEQTRKLVESDEVLLDFYPVGTAPNVAIQKYMNQKKVPTLFVGTGVSRFNDPQNFPWTMGLVPTYRSEARIYAKYILENLPGKTIGILYQNDDFGKDYILGLKDILRDQYAKLVVSEIPFEIGVPTIDSQVVAIKSANPDIFVNIATPKPAAQAIKKIGELGWHPVQIMSNTSASPGAVLKPAGYDNSKGILSATFQLIVTDPDHEATSGMKKFRAFMEKYYPEADKSETITLSAYNAATVLIEVLKMCGDNLTRENVMKRAAGLDMALDTHIPGVRIKTSPTDYFPIEQLQMMRFSGEKWELFGPVLDSHLE